MARFRSKLTGSVVSVSDKEAGSLTDEYESVKPKAAAKKSSPSSGKSTDK